MNRDFSYFLFRFHSSIDKKNYVRYYIFLIKQIFFYGLLKIQFSQSMKNLKTSVIFVCGFLKIIDV